MSETFTPITPNQPIIYDDPSWKYRPQFYYCGDKAEAYLPVTTVVINFEKDEITSVRIATDKGKTITLTPEGGRIAVTHD